MNPSAAKALILNVEDNDPKRYLKTRALAGAGFDVIEASDAATARDLIRERHPDLVLLDVRLPDGNGRELCAWIKRSEETAQTAVIQTSALLVDSRERVASLDSGADGYLVEPIEPEELIAHVRALLRLRQAERERHAAMTALQEADRRKDEFLAMLAHELRNPLAPIRNSVEILRSDDPALRERARSIVARQVNHLARLVDDLLEVSRITQRKVVLKRARITLQAVVDAAVETARPLINANRHTLAIELPRGDVWLEVDTVRIAQAIGNLLHNAAKFTPSGGKIALEARVEGREVEIAVSDNGAGIPPELLGVVFDLFTQDDRSLARSQGGLGIGLSLVRGMVELHEGRVHAESAGRGHGSRFVVRLPLASEAIAPSGPTTHHSRSDNPKRVLIVEDNADCAETLCMVLQNEGHDVSVVDDGMNALALARRWRPEVVLMDLGMPGMDGFELAARMRAMPELIGTPLIAVSGYGQQKDQERSAAAGFDLHLTKPVEPARLSQAIEAAHAAVR